VPNNYTVNTLADTHEADPLIGPGIDSNGNVSLRSAIEDADRVGGLSNITFSVQGQINLTELLSLNLGGPPGSPLTITINGGGQITIARPSGALVPTFRILEIDGQTNALLVGLGMTNGSETTGGAILNNGTLNCENLSLFQNQAGLTGGAIDNESTLSFSAGRISYNSASIGGGAIFNGGSLTMTNGAEMDHNTVTAGNGGALINVSAGTANLNRVLIENNIANTVNGIGGDGGGIYNTGSVTMFGGDLQWNVAGLDGGGIYTSGANASASFTQVTISYNVAQGGNGPGYGGGFYLDAGSLSMQSCILQSNTALWGNGGVVNVAGGAVFNNLGENIINDNIFYIT